MKYNKGNEGWEATGKTEKCDYGTTGRKVTCQLQSCGLWGNTPLCTMHLTMAENSRSHKITYPYVPYTDESSKIQKLCVSLTYELIVNPTESVRQKLATQFCLLGEHFSHHGDTQEQKNYLELAQWVSRSHTSTSSFMG